MALEIAIRLIDTDAKIEKQIVDIVRTRLNGALHQAAPAIQARIREMCDGLISSTDEYQSLLKGQLLAELGIPGVAARVRAVVEAVKRGVVVSVDLVRIAGNTVSGGLRLGILQADYQDILQLPDATYISNIRYTIPWLDWLIIQGDRIIVFGYSIDYDLDEAEMKRSRSGEALMRATIGRGWRVPPEFSGTESSNFLTRAFDGPNVERTITGIMQDEVQKRLK